MKTNPEKCADWPRQLNLYLAEAQHRYAKTGLKWGEFDCCTFAFDWVLRCTGEDPMADYRGAYKTKKEALEVLRDKGGGTLLSACKQYFGKPVKGPSGHRGDVAYLKSEKACGIFVTRGSLMAAVFLGEGGLVSAKAHDAAWAFRVGR